MLTLSTGRLGSMRTRRTSSHLVFSTGRGKERYIRGSKTRDTCGSGQRPRRSIDNTEEDTRQHTHCIGTLVYYVCLLMHMHTLTYVRTFTHTYNTQVHMHNVMCSYKVQHKQNLLAVGADKSRLDLALKEVDNNRAVAKKVLLPCLLCNFLQRIHTYVRAWTIITHWTTCKHFISILDWLARPSQQVPFGKGVKWSKYLASSLFTFTASARLCTNVQ